MECLGRHLLVFKQVKDILNRRFQVNSQVHISFLGFSTMTSQVDNPRQRLT